MKRPPALSCHRRTTAPSRVCSRDWDLLGRWLRPHAALDPSASSAPAYIVDEGPIFSAAVVEVVPPTRRYPPRPLVTAACGRHCQTCRPRLGFGPWRVYGATRGGTSANESRVRGFKNTRKMQFVLQMKRGLTRLAVVIRPSASIFRRASRRARILSYCFGFTKRTSSAKKLGETATNSAAS